MVLSDKEIKKSLRSGEIIVENLSKEGIQPASIDLKIGRNFLVPTFGVGRVYRFSEEMQYKEYNADTFIIRPHSFVLATTEEYIKIPNNIAAFIEGRSSIGRLGLFIQNAGWVDPGFEGEITLELFNASNYSIEVPAGKRVAQIVFCKMDKDAKHPYAGKYQGQKNATGSRIQEDKDNPKIL